MSPQLNPAQLQHAIDNGEKLVAAKKLEMEAYRDFRLESEAIAEVFSITEGPNLRLISAIENWLDSKVSRCEVELEELEMQVKAYKFMQKRSESRIEVPGARMG